jgi:hypothetical protein
MTWLRQYQSHPDAFLLRDYPAGEQLAGPCGASFPDLMPKPVT